MTKVLDVLDGSTKQVQGALQVAIDDSSDSSISSISSSGSSTSGGREIGIDQNTKRDIAYVTRGGKFQPDVLVQEQGIIWKNNHK